MTVIYFILMTGIILVYLIINEVSGADLDQMERFDKKEIYL